MTRLRAQVVLQGATNLPEDRFVNVFHFVTADDDHEVAVTGVQNALLRFYGDTTQANPVGGVGQFLSPFVKRPFEIRWYDLDEAMPRQPYITPGVLQPVLSVSGMVTLPEEVAVCMSFHGAPPMTARRRGRVYLGPLVSAVMAPASTTSPTQVAGTAISDFNGYAKRLQAEAPSWSIYSPTTGLMVPVQGGWIDNAFDTQRRRGPDATARLAWSPT